MVAGKERHQAALFSSAYRKALKVVLLVFTQNERPTAELPHRQFAGCDQFMES
jgi:hypothetical protein